MLFHNDRDGTFADVTSKAGVGNERWGFGVAVADYDNDGWPDIYVANYGKTSTISSSPEEMASRKPRASTAASPFSAVPSA
jgi:hypothetical protein